MSISPTAEKNIGAHESRHPTDRLFHKSDNFQASTV